MMRLATSSDGWKMGQLFLADSMSVAFVACERMRMQVQFFVQVGMPKVYADDAESSARIVKTLMLR